MLRNSDRNVRGRALRGPGRTRGHTVPGSLNVSQAKSPAEDRSVSDSEKKKEEKVSEADQSKS